MLPNACVKIKEALAEVPYIAKIATQDDYEKALSLMDELIDDYVANKGLIEVLSVSIERWEEQAEEFSDFNAELDRMDNGIAVMKTLMSQHNLGVADLPEVGSKSTVSKLLNNAEGKQLNRKHIEALSQRFGVSPALFF